MRQLVQPFFDPQRCLIIAEVAQAHDGSLGTAHAFIDAVARTGADAVKFQTHLADAESTPGEPWRVKFSAQDVNRYSYWKRIEFTEEQWRGLKQHANERKLMFLSSPFSLAAVELLSRVGVAAWKIASGEVNNLPLVEQISASGLPIILSSGMNSLDELDESIKLVQSQRAPLAVLQCTSAYPCPPEQIGLNVISELRQRYGCAAGLSDHSGTIFPGLAAATLGIEVLEVHVTLSRESFGPDVSSSVTSSELRQLVDGIRFIERMKSHPVNKDAMAKHLAPLRSLFTKSIVARIDLPAGTLLRPEHLTLKKPGTGLPPSRLSNLLDRRLKQAIARDTMIFEEQLESLSESIAPSAATHAPHCDGQWAKPGSCRQ